MRISCDEKIASAHFYQNQEKPSERAVFLISSVKVLHLKKILDRISPWYKKLGKFGYISLSTQSSRLS